MKRSRLPEKQIIGILCEQEAGMKTADVCRRHDVSQGRACAELQVDRLSVRYRSVRPDDMEPRDAVSQVAGELRRFGCRHIHRRPEWQGIAMNHKKMMRRYRKEKPQIRKRGGRKRALGIERPMLLPNRTSEP